MRTGHDMAPLHRAPVEARSAFRAPRAAHELPQFVSERTEDTPYAAAVLSTTLSRVHGLLARSLAVGFALSLIGAWSPSLSSLAASAPMAFFVPTGAHAQAAAHGQDAPASEAGARAKETPIAVGRLRGRVRWSFDGPTGAQLRIELGRGRQTLRWRRSSRGEAEVTVTQFKLGRHRLALVRVSEADQGVAVLFNANGGEVIHAADEFYRGDPGERVRERLRVSGLEDGSPIVERLQESERQRTCEGAPLALFAERLAPSLSWRRMPPMEPVSEASGPASVSDSTSLPSSLLEWTGVTGGFGAQTPSALVRPTALSDGDPRSEFRLTSEDRVRAEARWTLPTVPPKSLVLRTATSSPPPTRIRVGLDGRSLILTPDAASRGQVLTWTLPATEELKCVTLELENESGQPVALSDLSFETALHGSGDPTETNRVLQAALERLETSDPESARRAARTLAIAAQRGRDMMVARWHSLSSRAKRRGLGLARARLDDAELWVTAALDSDERVFDAVKARAERWTGDAEPLVLALTEALIEASNDALETRRAWALGLLARGKSAKTVGFFATELAPDRPLRIPIRAGLRALSQRVPEVVRQVLAEVPEIDGAQVALALAGTPLDAEAVAAIRDVIASEAPTFDRLYAAVQASAGAGRDEAVDTWLQRMAAEHELWMVRRAAIEALAARGVLSSASLNRGLRDPYPRVRMAAMTALPKKTASRDALQRLLKTDPWPLVRATAVEQMARMPEATEATREGLTDPSRTVRRITLQTLTRTGDRDAAAAVGARLRRAEEWPDVQQAAIEYARALCVHALEPALVEVAERSLDPRAPVADRETGTHAVLTLAHLGSDSPVLEAAVTQDPTGRLREQLEQQKHESSCSSVRR